MKVETWGKILHKMKEAEISQVVQERIERDYLQQEAKHNREMYTCSHTAGRSIRLRTSRASR